MTSGNAFLPPPNDDAALRATPADLEALALDVATGRPIDISRLPARARAVLYLRVSTPGQVNTDYDPEGISIPAQREAGRRKADSLNADVVREFVEPGRTATNIDKRPAFQEMIAWVKAQKNIDYVIVYHFNRVFRNSVDAGITKRDLKKIGTRVVSTVIDMGDNPESALVESILHAVDQYQSEASGADISYKMGQKAKHGGTLGRAPLGYLNVFERLDDRQIRTVALDPERAPFVKLAFELYATGDYTLADLSDELYDRGLRTRATKLHPTGQVSINKLWLMLRDRYYLGFVTYKGEEIEGRHEALIDDDLFGRVQDILETRSLAGERRRIHHHYLKGSLFCGHCHQAGTTGRMIIQHTVNRRGTEYTYFFCRNTQDRTCSTPHVNVIRVEDAVEAHYATVQFSPEFIATMRAQLAGALDDEDAATRLLHQQLTNELRRLDAQEDNLIELAADSAETHPKIKQKLHDIKRQREHLRERLNETTEDLSDSVRLIDLCLTLLEHPQELYRRCDEEQRRLLNQALFDKLLIDYDQVTGHELREPFAQLHAVQRAVDKPDPGRPGSEPQDDNRAVSPLGSGPTSYHQIRDLLGMDLVRCSSSSPRVELRGLEPLGRQARHLRNSLHPLRLQGFPVPLGTARCGPVPSGVPTGHARDHEPTPAARLDRTMATSNTLPPIHHSDRSASHTRAALKR
jgi:site-specific DNA recombinase